MSSTTQTELAAADCEVVDTKTESKSDRTQLCMFVEPMDAAEVFERTARYARGPEAYLRNLLGDAFEERRPLLSVPKTVDLDRYGTGVHKQAFEQHIAQLLGKKHGLFFHTGVQAQLAALRIHCDRAEKRKAAWHVSSHLESAEERSFELLYGLERVLLGSDPETLPTVEEIKAVLSLPAEQRPAVVLLEIPNRVLGCKTYTFDELKQIASACKEARVALHLDGARLWEIEPYYRENADKTFADVASLFDTAYVSFYKGLRGATGAILVSDDETLINEAKSWQRRTGGNSFTLGYEVIDDERGYNENIGTFEGKWRKMTDIVEDITAATAGHRAPDGRKIVKFVPDNPTCCQTHTVFQGYTADELTSARDAVAEESNVRVFERLRPKMTVDESMRAARAGSDAAQDHMDDKRHFMEWMIVSTTEKLDTQVFVDAYVALCEKLLASKSS